MKWTDDSSYRHGERGNVPPTTWMAEVHGLELIVTRHIGFPKNTWVGYVRARGTEVVYTTDLKTDDVESAKTKLVKMLAAHAKKEVTRFQKVSKECAKQC